MVWFYTTRNWTMFSLEVYLISQIVKWRSVQSDCDTSFVFPSIRVISPPQDRFSRGQVREYRLFMRVPQYCQRTERTVSFSFDLCLYDTRQKDFIYLYLFFFLFIVRRNKIYYDLYTYLFFKNKIKVAF